MFLAVDTHYHAESTTTAGVLFEKIEDARPRSEHVVRSGAPPEEYVPGEFYKRELPEILRLLGELPVQPACILIDGYCTLDAAGTPGLGCYLWQALSGGVDIIGIAKTAYKGSAHAQAVYRGKSQSPLFVTACGNLASEDAAAMIASMHGAHRLPDLLKRADQLCRQAGP